MSLNMASQAVPCHTRKIGDVSLIHDEENGSCRSDIVDLGDISSYEPSSNAADLAWGVGSRYEQLEKCSIHLADQLLSVGVKSGDVLTLCLQEPLLMAVAALGVMKAGCTSVVLDPARPQAALPTIIAALSSSAVLISATSTTLIEVLGLKKVHVIGHDLALQAAVAKGSPSPYASSSSDATDELSESLTAGRPETSEDEELETLEPSSKTEKYMKEAWGSLFKVNPDSISRTDNFFQIGGDYVKTLQLSKMFHDRGILLEAREIFEHPILHDISTMIDSMGSRIEQAVAPFSLLQVDWDMAKVKASAAYLCNIRESQVLDVFPCTPLQEGLLALTVKHPGDYVAKTVFELRPEVDLKLFRAALEQTVVTNPILRTRIVSIPECGILQVVVEEGIVWSSATDLDEFLHHSPETPMSLGTPLSRFILQETCDGAHRYFLWELHHAVYDGVSLPLLLKELEQAYRSEFGPPLYHMSSFVKYVQECDEVAAAKFWRKQFNDLQCAPYPMLKSSTYSTRPDQQQSLTVDGIDWGHGDFTNATIIRAAWCATIAQATGCNEAIFGVTITGRQVDVPGIDRMEGPAISTVPIYAKLNLECSVNDILKSVQRQSVEMIPFQQMGLQHIRRVSEAAALACNFQTLLVIQPSSHEDHGPDELFLTDSEEIQNLTSLQWQDFSTYPLVIECQVRSSGIYVRLAFDSKVMRQQEVDCLLQRFKYILTQLTNQENRTEHLGTVVASDPFGLDRIWNWNSSVPDAVEETIHDLISQHNVNQPHAMAVCAWDGNLTYARLDDLSTVFAHQLLQHGIKSGHIVPLCFEKSMWMPVAALAVMKTGAASVALDMAQPEERLRAIVTQVHSPIILTSVKSVDVVHRLKIPASEVLILGPKQSQSCTKVCPLPTVHPSDLLYLVFTSGSTGQPKGAMITHQNFRTAIEYQQEHLGFSSMSRVLDFASYAFDAAWCNLIHALTAGGCLCIPSSHERQNNLAECIQKYKVTTADFTPSVARFIGSRALSNLHTLILGGEAVLPGDAYLLGDGSKGKIINVYGPAECTPTVTLSGIKSEDDITIGIGAGVCTWIVDMENTNRLAPLGNIGELWIEGPLVGQGYLDDPTKTSEVFVQDPAWLLQGASGYTGRHGRLYRTGDLVRYRDDGSLLFMGRKDNQVKIRGQRVELGEIEHHIKQAIEDTITSVQIAQVVVETIQPKGVLGKSLVAFVTLSHPDQWTEDAHATAVRQVTAGFSELLSNRIPIYMIPDAFIPIMKAPISSTGKTDRRQLRTIGESLWLHYRNSTQGNEATLQLTDMEKLLQEVWKSVLNLSIGEISINKSFMRLGGDSITAMQVVSQCRLRNISITVSDVLQASTIHRLAMRCQSMIEESSEVNSDQQVDESTEEAFDLSPIQQMFFDAYPNGLNHFNQSFVLELTRYVSSSTLIKALQEIASRHLMLRARFRKDQATGIWKQAIALDDPAAIAFSENFNSTSVQIGEIGQWRQEHLDIEQGPVFACDLFNPDGANQVVVLSAHHLVIDLVSWRIIWNDIEEHIAFGKLRSKRTVTFREWSKLQAKVARNMSPLTVLPHAVPRLDMDFWGLDASENTISNCQAHTEVLDLETSRLLFGDSNECLQTEPIDIIIGVLAHSFYHTFPERAAPTLWVEGHGREQYENLNLDVSNTVGWFTTMHPLHIDVSKNSTVNEAIRFSKDTRRKVPSKGQPYFACRYHSESGREAFKDHSMAEVTLNFTGSFQQLEGDEGLFRRPEQFIEDDQDISEVSKSAHRQTLIEINADVEEGQLAITWQVHKNMEHQDRLQQWSQRFAQTITLASHNLVRESKTFTLSDLPLLHLSYSGLDALLGQQFSSIGIKSDQVVDIYPCSPLQEGIILSLQKGIASYDTCSVWRCLPRDATATISPAQLESAWKLVASRHSILSTIFSLHPDGDTFIQIQLSGQNAEVRQLMTRDRHPAEVLMAMKRPTFIPNQPQHAFTVAQSNTGDVSCRLDVNHALIDAISISVLLQEIQKAYDGHILPQAPVFKDMISYIASTPRTKILSSWTSLLIGVQPCHFPVSTTIASRLSEPVEHFSDTSIPVRLTTEISSFCRNMGITRSVFLQVAWAMVLSHFTSMKDVCFGYISSGRGAPVDGVHSMVGPLANLLISRIDLQQPARVILEETAQKSIQHLSMEHVSLAEIQHKLDLSGKQLFNTSLSVREGGKPEDDGRSFSFESYSGEDPHEFDLSLSANISGDQMDIVLEFRESHITLQVAREASVVLEKAIDYLLETVTLQISDNSADMDSGESIYNSSGLADSLFTSFFEHVVGSDEASAAAFWALQLNGIQGSFFPLRNPNIVRLSQQVEFSYNIGDLEWDRHSFSSRSTIKAAWSVITATKLGSNESIFGETVWESAFTTLVPIPVILDWNRDVEYMLTNVERQQKEMSGFKGIKLSWLRKLSTEAALACDFRTLFVFLPDSDLLNESSIEIVSHNDSGGTESNYRQSSDVYALTLTCQTQRNGLKVAFKFDRTVIDEPQVMRLIQQFEQILRQLLNTSRRKETLKTITLSQQDLHDIWTWNATVPESYDVCVHHLIEAKSMEQPEAQAVCAWDGNLMYGQLQQLSAALSRSLVQEFGVGRGTIISLCFEKSMWMPVVMLAVMKAGGASVAMDISQPEEALRVIAAGTQMIISSPANEALARRLGKHKIFIFNTNVALQSDLAVSMPTVNPADTLYVVYTSGSTGVPKGVMVSHRNFSSAIMHQRDSLGYSNTSRVLDFSSYAFDVAWSNLLNTLTVGGCLCIPSTTERQNDIGGCLQNYDVNFADLTPSIVRQLDHDCLSSLSTLLMGGEVVLPSDRALAGTDARVISAYGPAECTPTATILELTDNFDGIGRGLGVCTWVVQVDSEILSPIGAVGELWLEGPLVGQGYANDPERTATCFIEDPVWLVAGDVATGRCGRRGMTYRTGDLVQYKEDGSLLFLGRKDTQVKIRGQRVELDEVGLHVQQAMAAEWGTAISVIAETITLHGNSGAILVAFVALDGAADMTHDKHSEKVRQATSGLTEILSKKIPIYLVPSVYIPIRKIPLMTTGKTDRRLLRSLGSSLTVQDLAALSHTDGVRKPPQSEAELLLQELWSKVLHVDPDGIAADDSFFRIGGDSIGAMKLAAMARQRGIHLSVSDIFHSPVLRDLANYEVFLPLTAELS